jgi:hypothetical protein
VAIGKKIGNLNQVIKSQSELNIYILRGLFEDDIQLGGEITDGIQDDFLVPISQGINYIMLKSLDDGRFAIQLNVLQKNKTKDPDGKPMHFINGKDKFIIEII